MEEEGGTKNWTGTTKLAHAFLALVVIFLFFSSFFLGAHQPPARLNQAQEKSCLGRLGDIGFNHRRIRTRIYRN